MIEHQHLHRAICPECDLTVSIESVPEGERASCPRCDCVIYRHHRDALDRILVFSTTTALCLLISSLFSFMEINALGKERGISLLETGFQLIALSEHSLGLLMLIVIIGIPLSYIGILSWLVLAIKHQKTSFKDIRLLHTLRILRFWNMAEIFFLSILVSMIKLVSLAEIQLGAAFWIYALSILFLIATILHTDHFQLARMIQHASNPSGRGSHA